MFQWLHILRFNMCVTGPQHEADWACIPITLASARQVLKYYWSDTIRLDPNSILYNLPGLVVLSVATYKQYNYSNLLPASNSPLAVRIAVRMDSTPFFVQLGEN